MNSADHTGKFDLIFEKKFDYHYVACDIQRIYFLFNLNICLDLLNTADKMCKENFVSKNKTQQKTQLTTPISQPHLVTKSLFLINLPVNSYLD